MEEYVDLMSLSMRPLASKLGGNPYSLFTSQPQSTLGFRAPAYVTIIHNYFLVDSVLPVPDWVNPRTNFELDLLKIEWSLTETLGDKGWISSWKKMCSTVWCLFYYCNCFTAVNISSAIPITVCNFCKNIIHMSKFNTLCFLIFQKWRKKTESNQCFS